MYKLKEFNTITASLNNNLIYFECENGMEARFDILRINIFPIHLAILDKYI